jgi:hypothetical protein
MVVVETEWGVGMGQVAAVLSSDAAERMKPKIGRASCRERVCLQV